MQHTPQNASTGTCGRATCLLLPCVAVDTQFMEVMKTRAQRITNERTVGGGTGNATAGAGHNGTGDATTGAGSSGTGNATAGAGPNSSGMDVN